MSGGRERYRIALEVEVQRDVIDLEPSEWDLDDLTRSLSSGVAALRRVIRGRVIDEEHDRLSRTLRELAEDLDQAVQLHWLGTASPEPLIRPADGAPRPSLETLVELRALSEQARRVADRLLDERL